MRKRYTQAVVEEMDLRPTTDSISSVYLGGGTPTQLELDDLQTILSSIRRHYQLLPQAEITIEANPGDLNLQALQSLRQMGFNRLSIGVQSFNDQLLRLINRRHTAKQALQAVSDAREAGFDNISLDLIYGIPTQTINQLKTDIQQTLDLNIEHISTYCMTYEQGTLLTKMIETGALTATDDDTLNQMFDLLINSLINSGYEHYEVSNFAKPNCYSRHNSAYWKGQPYIGLGAAAHSYDGKKRQWNIADIDKYIQGVTARYLNIEEETLSSTDFYNEKIMLGLRTARGVDLSQLQENDRLYCSTHAQPLIDDGLLEINNQHLKSTRKGLNILNFITLKLMQ